MTGCAIMPGEAFKVLRAHPDDVFTLDQVCTELHIPIDVPDNRHAVIWALSRLQDRGKIELRYPVGPTEGFGYVWPAPIETDPYTGRKFKWTADGRKWLDQV